VIRYLLDTNILSELRKGTRASLEVTGWFDEVDDEALFTSVLVIGEIRRGIELARKADPKKAKALEKWLNTLVQHFSDRILVVDDRVADCWGRLCVDQKLPDVDGLLAATALTHDLTLCTRNTADFERSGVKLFNPFLKS
jgi:predicted nucleic acid-binding protein